MPDSGLKTFVAGLARRGVTEFRISNGAVAWVVVRVWDGSRESESSVRLRERALREDLAGPPYM